MGNARLVTGGGIFCRLFSIFVLQAFTCKNGTDNLFKVDESYCPQSSELVQVSNTVQENGRDFHRYAMKQQEMPDEKIEGKSSKCLIKSLQLIIFLGRNFNDNQYH